MYAQNVSFSLDTCGSTYDTLIAIYEQGGSLKSPLAISDDTDDCPNGGVQSRLTFSFGADAEYLIVVVSRVELHTLPNAGVVTVFSLFIVAPDSV